jgi:ABC-2 type transport system permease protein
MAVYERTYKRYVGGMTPQWTRFLVLPRYALKDVFKSKFFLVAFVICFLVPLSYAIVIYGRNNATVLELFPDFDLDTVLAIDANFFRGFLFRQFHLAFALALIVGPGLVSRDLANNGLPLYLSRPFSRAEYVLGKFSVLAVLLSAITWVPGWLLFALQSNYAGSDWATSNLRLLPATFLGAWACIAIVSLMALALSAWVRWRPVAAFLMLFIVFAGWFFGNVLLNPLFRVEWGGLFSLAAVGGTVLDGMFGLSPRSGLSVGAAWVSFLALGGFFLFLLHRKTRAYEVVR